MQRLSFLNRLFPVCRCKQSLTSIRALTVSHALKQSNLTRIIQTKFGRFKVFGKYPSKEGLFFTSNRFASFWRNTHKPNNNTSIVLYTISGAICMVGVSYISVPLYRMFCQVTGIGGDPTIGHKTENVSTMKPIRDRPITVIFNADRHAAMQWNFKPSQPRVTVVPGETALAFYTAKNPTDTPIVGVATYNVVPFQAGPYFNKIQCFCFEEQWLNPHEEVDMPVFFYIDPEFDNDPQLAVVDEIVLSYTFFKAEQGQVLPVPGFMNAKFTNAQNPNVS